MKKRLPMLNMILFKTIIFSILVPGTVVGLVPYLLLTRVTVLFPVALGLIRYSGIIPMIIGVVLYIVSATGFVEKGKGTPAPVDPPRLLVTSGPYRFTRNPMYLGGTLILLGEAVLFESAILLAYLLFICSAFSLFVVFYEEPHLRKVFGPAYEEYCRNVPRWLPFRRAR
jgi:protein-S-isoprenylcysteine O-methyltransferase Ste14